MRTAEGIRGGKELEKTGFTTEWDKTAKTKIAVKDFKWDKYYTDNE